MKAIILAAGKGSRLKPLTNTTPKPLLPILGKPILAYIIESLPDEIDDVYIVGQYLIEQLETFCATHRTSKKIQVIQQTDSYTGTMAALLSVQPFINTNERFLVLNGDDLHAKEELEQHLKYQRTFGVQHMHIPYYAIESENGIVQKFRKQTEQEKTITGAKIANGVYLLDTQIFGFNPVVLSDGDIGIPQTILANTGIYPVHEVESTLWKPINTTQEYQEVQKYYTENNKK